MLENYSSLVKIGVYSYYLPFLLVLFLLYNKNSFSKFEYLLFFFVTYNALLQLIEELFLDGRIDNFNPIYNIQTIVDFCSIISIFSILLKDFNPKIKKQFNYLILLYVLISISELLFINDLFSINLYANNLSKFLIIIIASFTIYLSEIKIKITSSQKIFTYTIFIYSILTLPITLFEEFIRFKLNSVFIILWSLNILFVILYNLSLTLALWKLKK
jgi:hypothetical protein